MYPLQSEPLAVFFARWRNRPDSNNFERKIFGESYLVLSRTLCKLEQGGQLRFTVSTVIGHGPPIIFTIYGTEGTIRVEGTGENDMTISAGRKGDDGLAPVQIAEDKRGVWRVEEEFINAIRGIEPVTHTDFYTGLRYMEWTDAVTRSLRTGEQVNLPLDAN